MLIWGIAGLFAGIGAAWFYVTTPTRRNNERSNLRVDESRLQAHVAMLSRQLIPRSHEDTGNLDRCAEYISGHFVQAGASVEFQRFSADGRQYANVIGRFGSGKKRQIVVGAHYDAALGTPGADDNASGIAGLIELAYLIRDNSPDAGIELVAYTLEEPPFYDTEHMGSAVHAASIAHRKDIEGVIVLEMIGYFDDAPGSQDYPFSLLKLFYPDTGNFVALVGKLGQGAFMRRVKNSMRGTTDLPVCSINAPSCITGIDFSDHRSYWPHGFDAVMVTDTAFYRNKSYHEPDDLAERLDYQRMAQVVVGVFEALRKV